MFYCTLPKPVKERLLFLCLFFKWYLISLNLSTTFTWKWFMVFYLFWATRGRAWGPAAPRPLWEHPEHCGGADGRQCSQGFQRGPWLPRPPEPMSHWEDRYDPDSLIQPQLVFILNTSNSSLAFFYFISPCLQDCSGIHLINISMFKIHCYTLLSFLQLNSSKSNDIHV